MFILTPISPLACSPEEMDALLLALFRSRLGTSSLTFTNTFTSLVLFRGFRFSFRWRRLCCVLRLPLGFWSWCWATSCLAFWGGFWCKRRFLSLHGLNCPGPQPKAPFCGTHFTCPSGCSLSGLRGAVLLGGYGVGRVLLLFAVLGFEEGGMVLVAANPFAHIPLQCYPRLHTSAFSSHFLSSSMTVLP